jgi:diguanylate cyclase (GGDEF)-like protein
MLREEPRLDKATDWARLLSDVFRKVLSGENLDDVLERISRALSDLISYDAITIYEADDSRRVLTPIFARDPVAKQVLQNEIQFGKGVTGWVAERREPVLSNATKEDPRALIVPGTSDEDEALISTPLLARNALKGVLNVYRVGQSGHFTDEEFELTQRFADAASLALDNARALSEVEQRSLTDSLTGLYNHRHFHERLREELNRANRSQDATALVLFDIDDLQKVNDIHGYAIGDKVLVGVANVLRATVRGSDVPCRVGGEEFGVILPSCDAGDALGLASRLQAQMSQIQLDEVDGISISVGISQGPDHAMNAKELVTFAEAAMLTAKSSGGNRVVLYEGQPSDSSATRSTDRPADVRTVAYLKMLQSLGGQLNRLNNVAQIGRTIVNELKTMIDYHSCRVYITEQKLLVPIAAKGDPASTGEFKFSPVEFGHGVTGRAAEAGRPLLIPNALKCDFAAHIPGTEEIEESLMAVPLTYNREVIGVIVMSKLGVDQFRDEDLRLMEVLAGQASVAVANARLYEAERREADHAKALLDFASLISKAGSFNSIAQETVRMSARLLNIKQSSLWLLDDRAEGYVCAAHYGYVGDELTEPVTEICIPVLTGERILSHGRGPLVITPQEQETFLKHPPFGLMAVVPLRTGHGVKGWIAVRHPTQEGRFTEDRLKLLEGVSYQSSIAMQKANLYKEQREDAEVASALLEFSRELAQAEGMEAVVARVVELSARMLASPRTSVWIQDPKTGALSAEAVWGYEDAHLELITSLRVPKEIARVFLDTREPFVTDPDGVAHLEPPEMRIEGTRLAIAPLRLDSKVGCIAVTVPGNDEDLSIKKMRLLAGITDQAQLAIANAGSFASLERTFLETVESLANALEAKDEYTSSHARTITDMVLEVGAELGIQGKDLKRLELGALFHDIGKIGIPSDIIRKEGPLTDEEWAIIKTHPELGERILQPIDRLAPVRPIIRSCHESFDGSGYPDGLKGSDIPIESRIILVCDAFDAMTSDRPYRKRFPVAEACRRLEEAAGSQFDPAVVKAFLRCLNRRTAEVAG